MGCPVMKMVIAAAVCQSVLSETTPRLQSKSGKFNTQFFFCPRMASAFLRNLTVDLDLCCCSARIRVACCWGEPPAAPDIWGAWKDEAYNESCLKAQCSSSPFVSDLPFSILKPEGRNGIHLTWKPRSKTWLIFTALLHLVERYHDEVEDIGAGGKLEANYSPICLLG